MFGQLGAGGVGAASHPRPSCPEPQLAADIPEAVAQGTRRRLWPPTARRPLADGPQQGDAPQGPSAHPVPYPTHEGRALAPHLGLCTEPSGVRGSVLPPGPGLSAPLSSARDRLGQDGISGGTDGAAADTRWARVPPERAASTRLAHVGDLVRASRPGRAPQCRVSTKSASGPQAHWVSPGLRRRRPVNPSFPAARGPSEGAQDGCRIRAGEPGAPSRNRSSKVAARRPGNPRCPQAVMFSELAPSPASADAGGTPPPPLLLWEVPSGRESSCSRDPGVPQPPGPGEKVSDWALMTPAFKEGGAPLQERGLRYQTRAQATCH